MRTFILAVVLSAFFVGCAMPTAFSKRSSNGSPEALITPGTQVYEDVRCTFNFSSDPTRINAFASVTSESRSKYELFASLPLELARNACHSASQEIGMLCSEDCFGQQFTYNGLSKGTIKFVYREFSNGMVRQPYDLNLEYDADTKLIAFREKRFVVDGLTSEGIKLRPVSQ